MIQKLFDLVTGERGRTKQVIATLNDFLANAKDNTLTDEQAQKNLEEGVVELVNYDGQHSSNGLLITDNGYFLTARHCVENPPPKYIRLPCGNEYKFEKVCLQYEEEYLDLALAKAKIPGNCKSRKYKICDKDKNNLKPGSQVASLSRWNGKLILDNGFVQGMVTKNFLKSDLFYGATHNYASSIFCSLPTIRGDSGSIVVTPDASIVGIVSRIYYKTIFTSSWQNPFVRVHEPEAIMISKALELVTSYKQQLESRL